MLRVMACTEQDAQTLFMETKKYVGFTSNASKQPGRNKKKKKKRCLQTLTYEILTFKTNTVTSHVEQEGWVPMGMETRKDKSVILGEGSTNLWEITGSSLSCT